MSFHPITTHEAWGSSSPEFLQSWEWGEFQRAVGHDPVRFRVGEEYVQGFEHRLPLGFRFVYVPRVQISDFSILDALQEMKQRGFLFVRIEPTNAASTNLHAAINIRCRQPQHTLVLDLTTSEEILLSEMHSKTRYNIRLAEKKGVEIREGKNIDIFLSLNRETTARDRFKSHDDQYYTHMLEMPLVHQLTAWYEGSPIATQIYIGYRGTCTYLHGASSDTHRNLMAPYLLQWRSMQIAKQYGNTRYDMWGVAAPDTSGTSFHTYRWDSSDKLNTVTRYKAGFGGHVISYPDAYEVPLRPLLHRMAHLFKRVI